MDNPVVTGGGPCAVSTPAGRALRFNFGGVGVERRRATAAAPRRSATSAPRRPRSARRRRRRTPLAIVGYSFGAWVGRPRRGDDRPACARWSPSRRRSRSSTGTSRAACAPPLAVIVGDRDRFCPLRSRAALLTTARRRAHHDPAGGPLLRRPRRRVAAAIRRGSERGRAARAHRRGPARELPRRPLCASRLEARGLRRLPLARRAGAAYAPHCPRPRREPLGGRRARSPSAPAGARAASRSPAIA